MRVHLDAGTCQGHSRCYSLAPEVFDVDEVGFAVLTTDGELPTDPMHDTSTDQSSLRRNGRPDNLRHRVRLAAANCPEYAISIIDPPQEPS